MARPKRSYDSQWKEVKDINLYVLLIVNLTFAFRGLGVLVVTWNTVVLLGGFVSMIDKKDFWNLTLITGVQIIWINVSSVERIVSALDMINSSQGVQVWGNYLTGNWQLSGKARAYHRGLQAVKEKVAKIQFVLSLIHRVVFELCIMGVTCFVFYGLFLTAWISVRGLMERRHYGDKDGRTNMDPAHDLLYAMCVAQFALFLYTIVLASQRMRIARKVSRAYGFQDGGRAVQGYLDEIIRGCMKNPSSARGKNLVTYAVQLMESNSPLGDSCLSGTLILDRLITRQHTVKIVRAPGLIEQEEEMQRQLDLEDKTGAPLVKKDTTKKEDNKEESNKKRGERKKWEEWKNKWEEWMEERKKKLEDWTEDRRKRLEERTKKLTNKLHKQTEEEIIVQQCRVIKRMIGSASSTHILQKLLHVLDSRRSSDRKMREAVARIVEHVAGGIRLEQFPQGLQSIYSLINTFEEYHRLQPYQSSSSSSNKKEAIAMSLPPPPNTKNGQEQEQGSRSTNTSSLELKPEDSESESEPDPDSESEVDQPSLSTRLRIRWRHIIGKGSNTATTTSSSKSESDNGMDRPSSSKVNRSTTNQFHDYKELLLTGLGILWRLAGSEDNCTIISNTKHLVSKIMAPISYDLVHLVGHSAWSTQVVERSLSVMFRLIVTAKEDIGADLRQQIASDEGAITTMKKFVICEGCKGRKLQMKAIQILTQLSIDETANRGNLTKVLVSIFINGDSSNTSIRKTAGETLALLFLSSKSVSTLLPKEKNDEFEFIGDLAKIILQAGDDNACRKSAAEILEHLCIQYAENGEYLSTLKNTITGMMPEVLREICHGVSTGEEEKTEYARSDTDVESQSKTKRKKRNKKKNASSSPGQNQEHKLDVALLSLCVTACDKLHLDLDAVLLGQATGLGECAAFGLATKMVRLNRDLITADSLTAMKLTTRMVIAAMQKLRGHGVGVGVGVERADLESLMDSLSSVSETMLDLEGCMVFAAGTTTTKPATVDTLNSLVKQARQLYSEIRDQGSEIEPAS